MVLIKRFFGGMCLILVTLVVVGGCSTHLPGNPAYHWLNGKWYAERSWTTELYLEVVDGNIIIGTNIQTAPDGRKGTGDVRGTVEGEKVNFEVYFPHSGNTYTYALLRKGNALHGISSTGIITLQKVS